MVVQLPKGQDLPTLVAAAIGAPVGYALDWPLSFNDASKVHTMGLVSTGTGGWTEAAPRGQAGWR